MKYTQISVLGRNGFIGNAIAKRYANMGVKVVSYLDDRSECVFLFNSPSSVRLYDKDLYGCINETIVGFLHAMEFCHNSGAKLVYPSSATVYQKSNSYAHCKAALEEIQRAYVSDVLGLRITAGYGPGEGHKGMYASPIYQFIQTMEQGEHPVVWGNGQQTRDFVYIDDIVDQIVAAVDDDEVGVIDVCSGEATSFNRVVEIINEVLGTKHVPIYTGAPSNYVTELPKFPKKGTTSIEEGIKRCVMES